MNEGNRLLFITPWRGHSLIGTTYSAYDGNPDSSTVTEGNIQDFLNQINNAYPPACLTLKDVSFVQSGLLPSSGICDRTNDVQLSQHYQIRDHRDEGVQGLISVIGVKYTTARDVAQKVVDRVFKSWGCKPPKSLSSSTPLYGGQIERFETFLRDEMKKQYYGLSEETIHGLVYNYGSAYHDVLRYLDRCSNVDQAGTNDLAVLRAEILHGTREEMAQKLGDVIFRRTGLGTVGHPGHEILGMVSDIMKRELQWDRAKAQQEIDEVNSVFSFEP